MAPEFVGHIPLAHALTNELMYRRGQPRANKILGVSEYLGLFV